MSNHATTIQPAAYDSRVPSRSIAGAKAIDTVTAPIAAPRPVPHLAIRVSKGWTALNLRELWQFRDLMFTLALRDVKLRYRQTLLGFMWVILQPLFTAGVFTFLFGTVARFPSDGVPYFIYAYTGLLGWNVFNNTVGKVNSSMVGNAHLITKVYFPRLTLALATLYTTYFDFLIAAVLLVGMMVANRHEITIGPALFTLPLWLLLLTSLAMGTGLMSAAFTVRYRDVGQILGVAMQFLLLLSPVVYPASRVPQRYLWFYLINPVSSLLEAFRWSLLGRTGVHWNYIGYAASVSVGMLVAGAYAFKRMERTFVDVI